MKRENITINLLVWIENFLSIYRNYSNFTRNVRYIVNLRIFIETCVVLFTFLNYFWVFNASALNFTVRSYIFFSAVNSIVAFYLSCCKSDRFKEFVLNIEAVNKLYRHNAAYVNIIEKQTRSAYIDITIFTTFYTSMTVVSITTSIEMYRSYSIIVESALVVFLDLRYYCEFFIFYELIKVINAPLEVLNASVGIVAERIKTWCGDESDDELWGVQRELEKWGAASQHLVTAGDRLCDSFGVQAFSQCAMYTAICLPPRRLRLLCVDNLTAERSDMSRTQMEFFIRVLLRVGGSLLIIAFFTFSTTIYLITLLYEGVSSIVSQEPSPVGLNLVAISYSVASFIVVKLLIVSSGQRAIRNGDQLHKNLVMLHNLLVGIPGEEAGACARAASGLARRLRAAPLRLQLLPTLAVQMALLAEILAIVANYTIVLLQFNHVV